MSKHTPGPWEIYMGKYVPTEIAAGSQTYVIQTADEHNDNIGFACSWLDDPETLKEARANANLIAAAPELLEALEKLVKDFEAEIHNEYDGTGYLLEKRLSECDYARAAIAKAKGLNPDQG